MRKMSYQKLRKWINNSRFWKLPNEVKIMLVTGLVIVSILVLMAVFADFLSPFDPYKIGAGPLLNPPGGDYPLGTDNLGRDVYSRCLYGMRLSLLIGFGATLLASSIGSIVGVLSGYFGGIPDRVITFPMDAIWALPSFMTALLISVILGPTVENTVLAIGIGWIPSYYRTVRSLAISLRVEDFINAEISMGASDLYIIFRHVFPLCFSVIIILMTMGISHSVISVAGLGFLGLGVPPPIPELGSELAQARHVILIGAWWTIMAPSIFIFAMILGFNLAGEGLNRLLGARLEEI